MNRAHRTTSLAAIAFAGLGLIPLQATAAPPDRGADTCTLRLLSTKAVNLQHDVKGTDDVRAQLGNTTTRVRPYSLGQRRNTNGDGTETFTGTTLASLQVEILGGAWLSIDSRVIRCEERTRDYVFTNRDARYKARAVVDVVP